MLAYDVRPKPEVAEPSSTEERGLPPLEPMYGLGQLATSHAEADAQPDAFESLLDHFNFHEADVAKVRRVVSEALRDPRVRLANSDFYALAEIDDDSRSFAQEVLVHQLDVAEFAVMGAICKGYSDGQFLLDIAFAGLTHDQAKGTPELAPIFMDRRLWTKDARQKGQRHPGIAAQRQDAQGFSRFVRYLTDRHHQDLQENAARNLDGGYIGGTITPSDQEAAMWYEPSHIFSVADDIVANMRRRTYKDGMPAPNAVDQTARNLKPTPVVVASIDLFRSALSSRAA